MTRPTPVVNPDPAARRSANERLSQRLRRGAFWSAWPAWPAVPTLGLALAVLVGCGGGGEADSASSSSTTAASASSYTEGTLSGFGSIIVNGVRFDETSATVLDDAGTQKTASALKLGMQVTVDSGRVDASTSTAKAARVRFRSAVLGPVAAVDTGASSLTVLGQTVDVTAATVFGDGLSAGLSAVAADSVVEVHGVPDSATGHLVATRIEAVTTAPSSYKLRGTVAALDTTAKTFQIGAATVSYAAVATVPSTLADGVTMRVVLATASVNGVWQATALGDATPKLSDTTTSVHVRGRISAFTSATAFTVNGLAVDASAASFPDGSDTLALGVAVEVKGTVTNGVLVATEVQIESRHSGDDSRKYQLHGSVTSLDTAAKTFVLRGVTVDYSAVTTWTNGTEASLAVGSQLRVVGTVGASRTQLSATSIRFEQ